MAVRQAQLRNLLACVLCLWLGTGLALAQQGSMLLGSEPNEGETWTVALDGTAHFLSIQEAIDQAQNGDTIFIKAGKYVEDVTVHSKEGFKIIGEGMKKVFIAGLERVGTLHIGKWPYGVTNVEISGMTIQEHGGLGIGIFNGAGVTLRDIHVNGLIFSQQVQRVRIENCIIGGSETTGISFADSDAILIGNIIHDNDHGVAVGGKSNVTLKNNVITRSLFEAVVVADTSHASIVQNTLVNNGGGVKFQDESSGEIRGNIIKNTKVGIAYSPKTQVTASYNALHNNGTRYQMDGTSVASMSTPSTSTDVYLPPQFMAPDRGDFRLKADSPLIQVGEFSYLGALPPVQD